MERVWIWTDDPADPCAYCVFWVCRLCGPGCRDTTGHLAAFLPMVDGGIRVESRVWEGVHDDCAAAVAQYVDQTSSGVVS